jgi:hypothetical protein
MLNHKQHRGRARTKYCSVRTMLVLPWWAVVRVRPAVPGSRVARQGCHEACHASCVTAPSSSARDKTGLVVRGNDAGTILLQTRKPEQLAADQNCEPSATRDSVVPAPLRANHRRSITVASRMPGKNVPHEYNQLSCSPVTLLRCFLKRDSRAPVC